MPSTSTPSREASPATAPSIARRWSPWEAMRPPRRPPVPVTTKPSSVASMLGAERRGARRRRWRSGRSPSARSSCAPRTTVSPSAKQPSSATSGQLVDGQRHLVGLDDRADERAGGRRRGREIGSRRGDLVAGLVLEVADDDRRPCAARCARSRCASSSTPTPRRTSREPGHEHAGGDGERGARRVARDRPARRASSSSVPATVTWRPLRCTVTPAAASIRSVWSRLAAGSATVVAPSAARRGEQHARLDLRAGHRQLVVDRAQAARR